MRVFLTGATGLIGCRLVPRLLAEGNTVLCVSRDPTRARHLWPEEVEIIGADPCLPGVWQDRAALCDAVINLAGANVAQGRWTRQRRSRIRRSRLGTTAHLVEALARVDQPVTFISASAAGYYGNTGDQAVGERAQPGEDFLARLAVEWEHSALRSESETVRVIPLRIGVVLATEGGALARMLPIFRAGMGGPLGGGRQFLPWIHVEDLVEIILFILKEPHLVGPINASVPSPCRQGDFARTLGRVLGKPAFMPTPAWILKILMGDLAAIVLSGQRVIPNVLKAAGYPFRFPELEEALTDLMNPAESGPSADNKGVGLELT